jgi:hypothetical protein
VLDYPYVSAAEFRAHPTFLDSNNLRTGGTQDEQDAALTNVLLEASQWADDKVNMPLGAHIRSENVRLAADRTGRLRYHPEHAPVIAVTGMSVGASPDALDDIADPQVWLERDGRIIVAFSPSGGPGLGSLQFGATAAGVEQLVSWTYVAGYPSTQLAEPADAAATTLTVRDTTGITAGTVLRLWTPGLEEAVTVTAVAGDQVTLSVGLRAAHPAGGTCSSLPTTIRQAVIYYATYLLMRPASTGESWSPKSSGVATTSTAGDSRRTGRSTFLYDEAVKLLKPYKRIR